MCINYQNIKVYLLIQKGNTEQRKTRKYYFLPPSLLPFLSSFKKCLLILNSMETLPLSTKEEEMKMNMRFPLLTSTRVVEKMMLDCNNANSGTTG